MKAHDQRIVFSSSKQDWNTPKKLFNWLNDQYGLFTLDAAASDENALCEKYYDDISDGLENPWPGVVFLNPPYGRKMGDWVFKACDEGGVLGSADRVVCLLPSRTDTAWWHRAIMIHAYEIMFIQGRLHFSNSKDAAPFPSVIVVFDALKKVPNTSPIFHSLEQLSSGPWFRKQCFSVNSR